MLDYDDFDFEEFCEDEREIERRRQGQQSRHNNYRPNSNNHSSQKDNSNAGLVVGVIFAIAIILLMIAFSDFLGPILIVGVGAYLLAKWILG